MYSRYFGLNELPFSITPDPQYLFLSKRHQEALAHLLYGADESGGFVQLTGEVGTGKTTVCRAFLEQLPEQVDLALILNPALSVTELLHSICDEFDIAIPPETSSTKLLVDRLNQFLLEAHAHGRRPLLMIDEAQNLSPEVLEQIRLLTNLETSKQKLLQIFLVGQPELHSLLQHKGLRQLAQRITARYHLMPLSRKEVGDYIRHRLTVAGGKQSLFTTAALHQIHRYSGGIPRLINILCDRALLGAYATNRRYVNARIVSKALRELRANISQKKHTGGTPGLALATILTAVSLGLSLLLFPSELRVPGITANAPTQVQAIVDSAFREPIPPTPRDTAIAATAAITTTAAPVTSDPQTVNNLAAATSIRLADLISDKDTAWTRLFTRWGIAYNPGNQQDPCGFAKLWGLRCLKIKADWDKIRQYNRPALVQVQPNADTWAYLVVTGIKDDTISVDAGAAQLEAPLESVRAAAAGDCLVLWNPPGSGTRIIAEGASGESVRWLRHALGQVRGYALLEPDNPIYDQALRSQVTEYQRDRGLVADGIVGPETLIQLNTETKTIGIPTLN